MTDSNENHGGTWDRCPDAVGLECRLDMDDATWTWETTDSDRSGSSGDLAKLFKNETVKAPGVLAIDAPPERAALMAREVIQNSVDAAAELADELDNDSPELELTFRFETLASDRKRDFASELDLREVAKRAKNSSDVHWRARLGLDSGDLLDRLDDSSGLPILLIEERGTTGMFGSFRDARSKMYLALVSLGYTMKGDGAGGSYGYGKAGLIRGSSIRMVVAYTAFRERDDDPGVSRRLLGMTYWGQHELKGVSYTGFARYGKVQENGAVHPFENEEADAVAARLGIQVRDPEELEELGTTFLLIGPTVEPQDLCRSIERYWWPALEDGRLTAIVETDDDALIPRPMKDPVLRTFVNAYHLATTDQDNSKPNQHRQDFRRATFGERQLRLGALGLLAEPGGWSYESDVNGSGEIPHRSMVALIRGPRMVVEYLDVGGVKPHVRGVFVADRDVDELLRQTEPKAHDSWQTRGVEAGADPDAPAVADVVLRRIRENVRRFREQLRPAARPAEDVRLPELERLFRRMFATEGVHVPGPLATERPFSIAVDQRLDPAENGQIRLLGRVVCALAAHHEAEAEQVDVTISYRFVEDGGRGEEVALKFVAPEGFAQFAELPAGFRGSLGHERVAFSYESEPYPADWTARLKCDVTFSVPAHE